MSFEAHGFLEALSGPGPQEIAIAGHLLRRGSRVRLKPQPGGDILDTSLAGRAAMIEGIEQDDRGTTLVTVILEDDPGRDLAASRHPTHRFFFTPDEIEPVEESDGPCASRRVLVAGIGNVFLGDDGFGPAVAQRLAAMGLPQGTDVVDFGIRGLDLIYALGQPYDAVILVDAMARGGTPGCIQVIEPNIGSEEATPFDSHRMDPLAVLRMARRLGAGANDDSPVRLPPRILLVGCEPMPMAEGESMSMSLSASVAAVVDKAAEIVLELASLPLADRRPDAHPDTEDQVRGKKES